MSVIIYRTPADVLALAKDVAQPEKLELWLKFLRDRSAKHGKLPPLSSKPIELGINPS